MRRFPAIIVLAIAVASCSGTDVDFSEVPQLPPTSFEEIQAILESSEIPVVLNVWASWCVPCRSEAPLLDRAAATSAEVRFIGINVRDDQDGARSFIAEFFPDAAIEHRFDSGGNIPVNLGGSRGVPLTFFYAPGGELVTLHTGVIDERTLALQIDEILAR